MTYANLNTAHFDKYNANCGQYDVVPPSVDALAITLAMPSVGNGGAPAMRRGLKQPGLTTYYHAFTFGWQAGNADIDLRTFANITEQPSPSSKTNHIGWLAAAGLLQVYKPKSKGGIGFTALTDAGVAQVASVDKALGKVAKAFSVSAYEKAVKAAEKANKPVKAKRVKKPVSDDLVRDEPVEAPVSFEPVSDETVTEQVNT